MSNFICDFLSDSSGYYFYSAILQANAAILSIVGVFIIFRIQLLQSSIDNLKNLLVSESIGLTPQWLFDFFESGLEKQKKMRKEKEEETNSDKTFRTYTLLKLSDYIKNADSLSKIKSKIYWPTILLSSGIIFSALGLFFTNYLHSSHGKTEFLILLFFMVFEIFTIGFVVKRIFKIIKQ